MTDIRTFMQIVESMYRSQVKVELRDEPVFISYSMDEDGQLEWEVDGLGLAGTKAMNITPEETDMIDDACRDDYGHSVPDPDDFYYSGPRKNPFIRDRYY